MRRPIHFEIPAGDPARAMAFYETMFGWKFAQWAGSPVPYWVVTTGPAGEPGIDGGMMARQHPDQPCVNTIEVENLDASVALAEKSGGQCVVPKFPIPTLGWLAYCKDTEGHIFGMMETDPAAK
jgi:predicted enzyme related to lactoylglutathione lyase